MDRIEAYYDHRKKGWVVRLAETIFDPDKKIAEKTASSRLALYHAVCGFDSIYLDRLDELKKDILHWEVQLVPLQAKNKRLSGELRATATWLKQQDSIAAQKITESIYQALKDNSG